MSASVYGTGPGNSSGTDTSFTPPWPNPGISVGDLVIVIVGKEGTSTPSMPAGWTTIKADTTVGIFWKIMDSSDVADPDGPTVTWGSSRSYVGKCIGINGHDPVSPIADILTGSTGSYGGITPTGSDDLLIAVYGINNDSTGRDFTWTNDTSHATVFNGSTTSGNDSGVFIAQGRGDGTALVSVSAANTGASSHSGAYFRVKAPLAGPTTVKTINGIAFASIKTRNGVAWADIKSINGLT